MPMKYIGNSILLVSKTLISVVGISMDIRYENHKFKQNKL